MAERICSFPECEYEVHARGYCTAHYQQAKRGGPLRPARIRDTEERFWAKVDTSAGPDSCWPWLAGTGVGGYGVFSADGRGRKAHRVAFDLVGGEVPVGMMLDHTCHNIDPDCAGGVGCPHRACVNPAHLEVVTAQENTLRSSNTIARRYAERTHCKHGHEFTPENTYWCTRGYRRCATCHALESKRRRDARSPR